MATTTNYSWTTPDDTDLVKDGAAAIRTLGSSADTTVKNLNPGTTAGDIDYYTSSTAKARVAIGTANQVLQVNSGGTAPEWGVDPVADIITTAGDLIYGTAADTVARLGIGTAGQVLQVNSTATAPEWVAPTGGGLTWTLLNTGGTALTGATSITVSGISNQKQLMIQIAASASSANASSTIVCRPDNDTGSNYLWAGVRNTQASTYATSNITGIGTISTTSIPFFTTGTNAASNGEGMLFLDSTDTTGWKRFTVMGSADSDGSSNDFISNWLQGFWKGSASVTSITITSLSGNLDAGTVYIYGAV